MKNAACSESGFIFFAAAIFLAAFFAVGFAGFHAFVGAFISAAILLAHFYTLFFALFAFAAFGFVAGYGQAASQYHYGSQHQYLFHDLIF